MERQSLEVFNQRSGCDSQLYCQQTVGIQKVNIQRQPCITAAADLLFCNLEILAVYKSTVEKDILTATEIIKLKPETVRIYPSITLKNTRLAKLFQMGVYTPPTLEETVKLCAKLKVMFEQSNIKIIRMGLHTIDEDNYIAGPWHPAFSELCDSRIFYCKIVDKLTVKGEYKLFVNPKDISKAVGNKRSNIEKLNSLGYKCTVIQDDSIAVSKIRVERMNNSCF